MTFQQKLIRNKLVLLKTLKEAELARSRQARRWIDYSLSLPPCVVLEQDLAEYRRFSPIVSSSACKE